MYYHCICVIFAKLENKIMMNTKISLSQLISVYTVIVYISNRYDDRTDKTEGNFVREYNIYKNNTSCECFK